MPRGLPRQRYLYISRTAQLRIWQISMGIFFAAWLERRNLEVFRLRLLKTFVVLVPEILLQCLASNRHNFFLNGQSLESARIYHRGLELRAIGL